MLSLGFVVLILFSYLCRELQIKYVGEIGFYEYLLGLGMIDQNSISVAEILGVCAGDGVIHISDEQSRKSDSPRTHTKQI